MPHGEGHVTDIACHEIEGARLTSRSEYAHAALALDVVLPFVGVGVPMQLTHPPGSTWSMPGARKLGKKVPARVSASRG
jgi:hypothetical protein